MLKKTVLCLSLLLVAAFPCIAGAATLSTAQAIIKISSYAVK